MLCPQPIDEPASKCVHCSYLLKGCSYSSSICFNQQQKFIHYLFCLSLLISSSTSSQQSLAVVFAWNGANLLSTPITPTLLALLSPDSQSAMSLLSSVSMFLPQIPSGVSGFWLFPLALMLPRVSSGPLASQNKNWTSSHNSWEKNLS